MNTGGMTVRSRMKLLGLLAVIAMFGLFDHSLWSANDSREGAMISEMVREHCWVAPTFNGVHYLEKPPLLHWTGVMFCRLFGAVNEGLVRLPAAVYAFGSILIMLAWARALGREQAGFAAAFMCATSALFFEYARIVLTDSALTFMVVFSLWLFWRAQTAENRILSRYMLFLFVSAFSFYAKGLIGPGMIWISVLAWMSFQKRFRLMLALVPLFALVFVLVLAPWVFALWKAGGSHYLYTVFWENQFGRFLYFDDQSLPVDPYLIHKEPVYFYLLSLPVRLMPWTLLVIPALYYWFKRGSPVKGDLPDFLKTSLLAIVFLLHISSAKAACYALPLFPFVFLMTAVWLEDVAKGWPVAFTRPLAWPEVERRFIGMTFIVTGVAALAAPLVYVLGFLFHVPAIWNPCPITAWVCLMIAVITIVAGVLLENKIWQVFKSGRRRAALLTMPAVLAVVGIVGVSVFVPVVDFHRTYEPFAGMIRGEINAGRRVAFDSDSERDLGAFMFYLDSRLETFSLTNSAALNGFLSGGNKSAGVIVPTKQLHMVLSQLQGKACRVKRVACSGKKSDSFRLITVDPAVEERAAPSKPKSGKPKRPGK